MSLQNVLRIFQASIEQCDLLIADAHRIALSGASLFSQRSREQITTSGFLNMFIAWETFLESSILHFMAGTPTIRGNLPTRRVMPVDMEAANTLICHGKKYFDYTNHDLLRVIVTSYFEDGYPFEPHLTSIIQELSELKVIRNACAHTNNSTQIPLRNLAGRIAGRPVTDVTVYSTLTMVDSRPGASGTAFETYKAKLLIAGELIANG